MTAIRRVTMGAVAGAFLLGMSACGEDPGPDSTDNTVSVSLSTPSADDGALLITIIGPGLSVVRPASGSYDLFWRVVSANETRVIVVGDIVDGPIFTATAPEDAAASEFAASVTEVATRDDALRPPPVAGYSLSVTR